MFKIVLVGVLAFGITTIGTASANAATATNKVMWGKTELKIGQIGKVTILSDTDLVKIESNGSLSIVRTLKKGDEYRVYTYKGTNGGLYGVGASNFVQKGSKVKYETPSKSKLALLNKEVIGGLTPKAGLKLTYSPSFTEKTQKEFTTTVKNTDQYSSVILNYNGSTLGGYTYFEKKDRISLGISHSDVGLFDFSYPMIEGKQTKENYIDGNQNAAFYYADVISTTSTVKVKAGTFQNVVVIRTTNEDTFCLAPGIGIIKAVDKNSATTAELISFQ